MNFNYPVRITWERNPKWNEICAWGIEHFGLPGDRYITEPDEKYMCWRFVSPQDQLLFVTAWGNDQ
jgi:hypothetical protein